MRHLDVSQAEFAECFNATPIGLGHNLHTCPLFAWDNIRRLMQDWPLGEYFVAAGAARPGSGFYTGPAAKLSTARAFDELDRGSYRILLKRLEKHDSACRDLLSQLLEDVFELNPALRLEKIVRLESFLFASSAATITPFHFDPEINFFFQIVGEKTYHLYSPTALAEEELEPYFLRGVIDIGQVDLERRRNHPEFCYELRPGLGINHPATAPHWVETKATISVSYSFCIETERTRALGRTRAFNGLCRRLWMSPAPPGRRPKVDFVKAGCMRAVRPLIAGMRAIR